MKNRISNKLVQCLSLLLLMGIVNSCTDERVSDNISGGGGPAEKTVTFSVRVPGAKMPGTYALTATQENEVKQIAVLLFDAGGGYTYQPLWTDNPASITSSGTDGNLKTFTVKIPVGTYSSMMILANANRPLKEALESAGNPIAVGDSKAAVIGKLLLNNPGRWSSDSSDPDYKPIPMWGEIPATTVNSSLTTPITGIELVRMLAKINVTLTTPAAKANFKLKNVRLYNYNDRGQVAPNTSAWTVNPSVPASAQKPAAPANSPLTYNTTIPDEACANEIYTFESLHGTSSAHLNNTCLVVGGRYTGDAADSYYRIDFTTTSGGTVSYLPLLRNHSYEVNITGVSSSGLSTPEEAFKSRAVKIQAEILPWNDGAMSEVVSDGQYKLGVSQGAFTFTREARTATSPDNVLSITTDVPAGWKVDKVVDANSGAAVSWVKPAPINGNTGTTSTRLILDANAGGSRTAKIHINAGRLTYVVTVTQTTAAALMLTLRDAATNTIDITDLVFGGKVGDTPPAQSVKLGWMPVDKPVAVSRSQVGGNPFFAYSGGDQLGSSLTSITDPSGAKTLTIQPPAMTAAELAVNPFLEKISKIDFTVFNGTSYLTKSLFLRQFVYNFLVEETTGFYRLDGSTYTLRVKSNTGWKISSIVESTGANTILNLAASDNLRTTTSGGVTPGSGLDIKFRVATNASLRGTLTVKFASTDSPVRFAEKTLVLSFNEAYPSPHSGWAGSNIYWDSALNRLTFDDVGSTARENYQGVFFQWGSLWGIAPNGAHNSAWSTTHKVYKTSGGAYSEVTNVGWTAIPRIPDATNVISNPPSGKSERDRAYLYELSDEANGIGDICKFLTKMGYAPGSPATKWRMPTSNEFEAAASYSVSGSWSSPISNSPSGMYDNPGRPGWTKAPTSPGTYPNAFFPASGYRYTDGTLLNVGYYGNYWSGSPTGTNGYYLHFYYGNVYPIYGNSRALGFSVRCVRE